MTKCLECGVEKSSRGKFCSNKCKCKNYYQNHKNEFNRKVYASQKKRRKKYKEIFVENKGNKCLICGYSRFVEALTFHHLTREEKKFGIGGSWKSFNTTKQEVDKCILVCIRCHMEIEEDLYEPTSRSVNSNRYELNRKRAIERKQYFVELKGGKCKECNYSKCLRGLSFHHRDPNKKEFPLDLRAFGNRSLKKLAEEVDKCDLYCMRCHAELEVEIRQGGIEPPTCTL